MRNTLTILFAIVLNIGIIPAKTHSSKANIIVSLDGSGNYTKIQDAIDAVPSNCEARTIIYIKNGLYNTEKIIIPAEKKNITFIGEDREKTIISYHIFDCKDGLNNRCPAEDVAKWKGDNIRTSATLTIDGDGFRAENITFQNTAGPVGQAQAITVRSDKNIFINCNFKGYQDTIYFWAAGKRSYFYHCMILGRTDFIYGAGIAFFDACEIKFYGGGWITAPSTPKNQAYGFVFSKCKLTFITGSPHAGDDNGKEALGRPWHEYPKVAWIHCKMCKEIDPRGWPTTWRMEYAATSPDLHLYEYKNTGAGSGMTERAQWAGIRALTRNEVLNYTIKDVFAGKDNWNPTKKIKMDNKK